MKIAIITDALPLGGAERQVVVSAAVLARNGEHVEVIRYHPKNDFENFLREAQVKDIYISASSPFRLGRIIALASYLKRGRFDVVHAFKGVASIYGQIAAKMAGVKCFFGGYRGQASLSPAFCFLNQALSHNSAGWIVNSNGVKNTVHKDFKIPHEKIFVIRNAIHTEEFQSNLSVEEAKESFGIPPQDHTLSFIANFRPVKNPEMFFRVAERVMKSHSSVHFLVAGHIPEISEIETLCQQLGIDKQVKLLGVCEDIARLLRATDLLLLTSHNEGLPNVLIEAGAAGIPCVSTDNGADEILIDATTGYIVAKNDVQAMTERVIELLSDPALRRQMGQEAALRVTSEYSPETLYRNLMSTYERGFEAAHSIVSRQQ